MHLFGYGSLLHRSEPPGSGPPRGRPCVLRDHVRCWSVAMDNAQTIPGYKFHVDPVTGERPAVVVASLDLEPRPGVHVNGLAFPVEHAALALFDARERQYRRREVTELVDIDVGGPVYAFFGLPEARERFERGRAAGTAVVSREYHDEVRAGFALLGEAWLARFDATTEPPGVPLRPLRRVPVPPSPDAGRGRAGA